MRFKDLNWMDIERYLEHDTRIILATGATVQQAYLSLMSDVLIPERVADAAAERTQVLIAPPLNFGTSYFYNEFPGTISLSKHTYEFAVVEIIESLFHQGFRRFLILNGFNGNHLPPQLADFQKEGIMQVRWHDWWRSARVRDFEDRYGLRLDYANWGKNFPFTRVVEVPTDEKPPVNLSYMEERYYSARALLDDGSYGGPYQVDDELMQELFDIAVDEVVDILDDLRES